MPFVCAIACKVSHNLSSFNPPIARKNPPITFDDLVEWAAHQTVPSVSCNSDYEIPAALQAVETVVRTPRPGLDADKFPMFSVGWTWQGFCRDLDPCWSE